jgi:hypothetical protein
MITTPEATAAPIASIPNPRDIPALTDDGGIGCQIVDLNLFSGSSDVLRTNVGGFFQNSVNQSGNINLAFQPFVKDNILNSPRGKYFTSIYSFAIAGDEGPAGPQYSENKLIPNYKFIVSANGDPEKVLNDKFWKTLWVGGTYDEINYGTVFNNNAVYDDYYTGYMHPYSAMARQYLKNQEAITSYMEISYKYNSHERKYQNFATNIPSIRCLPDANLYTCFSLYASGGVKPVGTPSMMYNFLSYDDQLEPESGFLSMSAYLNDKITDANFFTENTKQWIEKKYRNVFFNHNYFREIHYETVASASLYPYGCSIKFPPSPGGSFVQQIEDREFSTRMLRILKEVFNGETIVPIRSKEFEKNSKYLTSSTSTDGNVTISDSQRINLKNIDLHELMLYSYNKIKCDNDNFIVVDFPTIETKAAYDMEGNYRHLNCANTLEMLDGVSKRLYEEIGVTEYDSLMNLQRSTPFDPSDDASAKTAPRDPQMKENEVIAYRVDKSHGPPGSQEVIQSYWFHNSSFMGEFNFFDSQVKYGEQYTYQVYEYRMVKGLKYRYSDLQLSRVIGAPSGYTGDPSGPIVDQSDPDYTPEYYCIEYYDPSNEVTVPDLLSAESYEGGGGASTDVPSFMGAITGLSNEVSSLATDAQRIAKNRAGTAEGTRPYYANFVMTVEPRYKIYEIPIMSKTVTVMDNPPNKLNIVPAYVVNNTNTLKFEIQYEGFASRPFPILLTGPDAEMKALYNSSNNMLESAKILHETVSKHRTVEVFRLKHRPTSFADFDGALIQTVDMQMDISDNSYNDICIYDRIPSNKKFYYAFRVKNDNGVPGYIKEVIEAEYINDGGFKYALFNTIYEEELALKAHTDVFRSTKKIFELAPSTQQTSLVYTSADFTKKAGDELENGNIQVGSAKDGIWEKTFKVRLTSKKTGKKIDLNVTYKQNNYFLGSE